MKPNCLNPSFKKRAVTLVEVMVAAGLLAVLMAGLTALNTTSRNFVRAQRETALSSYTVEQAAESFRARNWSQITNSAKVLDWVQSFSSDGLTQLAQTEFTATVSPFPPLDPPPTPMVVRRNSNGTCTVVTDLPGGFPLRSMAAVRLDLQLKWKAAGNGLDRVRETATVISFSGTLK